MEVLLKKRQTLPVMLLVLVTVGTSNFSAYSYRKSSECGPAGMCKCMPLTDSKTVSKRYRMDCSGTKASLRDICKSVRQNDTVVELNIHSANASFIAYSDLKSCKLIERLNMQACRIANISNNAFTGMTKLTSLDLSQNKLTYIYNGQMPRFLQPLSVLKSFKLRTLSEQDENRTLSYPIIPDLDKLEELHLDGLSHTDFPPEYKTLTSLKTLTLTGIPKLFCHLNILTNQTFKNVMNVQNLDISQCKIAGVEAGTFQVLKHLKRLDLSLNRQLGFEMLNNVSYGLQFTEIDFLNYSSNENTFGLGNILTKQDICYLRNTSLRELALDQLKLEVIETNVPILMPDTLEIIHVNENRFSFGLFLLQVPCMKNLKVLDAKYQELSHRPSLYVKDVHKNASYCRKIPETSCPYLDESYLYEMSTKIQNCLYFNTTPKRLPLLMMPVSLKKVLLVDSARKYKIDHIPVLPFDNMLEYLDVSGNTVYSLVGPVGPLNSLKYLNISRNYCFNIGTSFFEYTTNLEELDAQRNVLGNFFANSSSAETFKPLKKLKTIIFSHNQIKEISSSIFSYLVSLEVLDLSYNSIDRWTLDTTQLRNLSHLYLGSNSLESLPVSLTDQLTQLSAEKRRKFTIDLSSNPIKYVCRNQQFLTWMAKHKSSFIGFYHYTFLDENENPMTANEFETAVQTIDKHCRSYTVLIVITSVGISLFLSVVACGMVYRNRWKLRYLIYINKRRLGGYSSYEPLKQFKYDAFLSYSDENSEFRDEVLQALEDNDGTQTKLKLCVQERDFTPGQPITNNIIDAIQSSNKVIIALSKAYLKSKWCRYEFHMSRMESIYSRTGESILIIVMLEHMPLNSYMPLELAKWIRHESYLEYTQDEQGQAVFWGKLREAILE